MARKRMIGWKSLIIFLNDFSSIVYLIPYLACDFYNQFKISYGVTNGQLGWLLTAFAASAVPCYFFSGWIMDIFDAKNLIAASCYSTAAVAVGVAFCRSFPVLVILYFLFGIASVTFNWSAYLKTVRIIGDDDEQGRLFAITDIGYSAFSLLAQYVVIYVVMIVYSDRSDGFRYAYIIYAALSVLIGICIQATFPSVERTTKVGGSFRQNLTSIGHAVTYRLPWLIGAFTLGYYIVRSTATYINVYLYNASGISLVGSQFFTSTSRMVTLFIFSPIGGWVHDKMGQKAAKYIFWSAGGIIALFLFMIVLPIRPSASVTACVVFVFILALNALMSNFLYTSVTDANIPNAHIGSVYGIACTIGYSSDLWIYTLCGNWLDKMGNAAFRPIWALGTLGGGIMLFVSFFVLQFYKKLDAK